MPLTSTVELTEIIWFTIGIIALAKLLPRVRKHWNDRCLVTALNGATVARFVRKRWRALVISIINVSAWAGISGLSLFNAQPTFASPSGLTIRFLMHCLAILAVSALLYAVWADEKDDGATERAIRDETDKTF